MQVINGIRKNTGLRVTVEPSLGGAGSKVPLTNVVVTVVVDIKN
jgi:hypothetical protein